MAFQIADRVYETSTTQGTGTLNLAGATTGFQSFVDGVGTGNETYYLIDDGTDWEVGIGTVTSGTPDTLSRDTILESSNSDAAVNWGSGTRNVRISVPAEGFPTLKTDNTFTGENTFTGANIFQGDVRFTDAGELTIATGAITVTGVYHTVRGEGAAADDLVTGNGGVDGQILIIRAGGEAITVKTTGNFDLPADVTLTNSNDVIYFIYDGAKAKWVQVSATAAQGALADTALQSGSIGSQAEIEAETSGKILDGANAKYHPGIAKVWVNYTTITTTAIADSYNVTSLTDDGAGTTTITFENDFTSANYAVAAFAARNTVSYVDGTNRAAGAYTIKTYNNASASLTDYADVNFIAWGQQV